MTDTSQPPVVGIVAYYRERGQDAFDGRTDPPASGQALRVAAI